jgi:hypothetical protein
MVVPGIIQPFRNLTDGCRSGCSRAFRKPETCLPCPPPRRLPDAGKPAVRSCREHPRKPGAAPDACPPRPPPVPAGNPLSAGGPSGNATLLNPPRQSTSPAVPQRRLRSPPSSPTRSTCRPISHSECPTSPPERQHPLLRNPGDLRTSRTRIERPARHRRLGRGLRRAP